MINLIDVIIGLVVIVQAYRWAQIGFVRGTMSLAGFIIGAVAGLLLVPVIVPLIDGAGLQFTLSVLLIVALTSIGSQLGLIVSTPLHSLFQRIRLDRVNKIIGAAFGGGATLVVVWLFGAAIANSPFVDFNRQLQSSTILSSLNSRLPSPPQFVTQLGRLINPSDFPRVFLGQEPQPVEQADLPQDAELRAISALVAPSTVRIESTGCGGIAFGSGFIVRPGLVVTNAHVVAGTNSTQVRDQSGVNAARIVDFDPDMDLAVLSADGLSGAPLPLSTDTASYATQGAVVGYPGGGPLQIGAAAVLDATTARGANIYNTAVVNRPIYVLQANVVQGNSGGPVVDREGQVLGVVFATSVTQRGIGYAITARELEQRIRAISVNSPTASTMRCAA